MPRTKQEIQQEYHVVAMQAGDTYFKLQELRKAVTSCERKLEDLVSKKATLEEELKGVPADEQPVEAADSN